MFNIREIPDLHTHRTDAGADAVISVSPGASMRSDRYYSVGVHPWDTENLPDDWREMLEASARHPQVVAIGEGGLDARRGADLKVQEEVFRRHVELSEATGKPLIIHAVGTINRIIELRRELRPSQLWIVHGFRGKPQQARQLLRAGIGISLGEKFNAEVPAEVPMDMLWCETDESALPIAEIRARVAKCRECGPEQATTEPPGRD